MTLDDITELISELKIMREMYPDYSRVIEGMENSYHAELKKVAQKYSFKINVLYERMQDDKNTKL